MSDIWLPGFERVERHREAYPGTFLPGVPRRKVAHSTEGFTRNPAAAAAAHPNPPHLWVTLPSHPYAPRRKIQIYPLNVAARALHHPPGTPETNKMGAIQTEIEGHAADLHRLSLEDLDWLADEVWEPACMATGVDVSVFLAGVGDVNQAYGSRSRTRMSATQWRTFNGLCSHQNVPDNDHWDAGGLDLAYISRRLTGAPVAVPEESEEDDMAGEWILMWHEGENRQYVVLAQGGVNVGKHHLALPSQVEVFNGGYNGPVGNAQSQGQLLDSLPWVGAAPAWVDQSEEQILAELKQLPAATIDNLVARLTGQG